MARLSREFYDGDTVEIAKKLLGKYLVRRLEDGRMLVGRITETEAYVGRCDKACHAYNYRKTERTSTLFSQPGTAYVYLIYGMYDCLNFVTEPEGEPSAVLLRGVEPVYGTETMRRLRYGDKPDTPYRRKNFLNGPGKVCKAFGITRAQNRVDLTTSEELFLCDSPKDVGLPCPDPRKERLCTGPRIGVNYAEEAKDFPWRFWLEKEEI
jgi:DNA-3-methyladenine glycosylase